MPSPQRPPPTERSPLLRSIASLSDEETIGEIQHDAVYRRFNSTQKRAMVAFVTFAGLLPLFVSGSFIPSIPQIARDLDTTASMINLAISLSIFSSSVGSLTWASYSSYYGRRPIYIVSAFVQCIGSLGVSQSRSLSQLLTFRVLQAAGAASGLSNGVATIGDLYKLEERGTATGIFYAGVLLGPAIAPVAGGFAAEFYSWRAAQFLLFITAVLFFLVALFFFPETVHPGTRGVEKKANEEGSGGGYKFVWLNPFACLGLLRSPIVLCMATAGVTTLLADFFLVVPVAYTLGVKYNITSEAAIGALLIPDGIGSMLGATIGGYISDRTIVRMRKRRNGIWVPEDRLRGIQFNTGVLVPLSLLIAGFTTTYVDGTLGLVINLGCLFINGFGVDSAFGALGAYGVDILHDRSAEVTAATMAYRGTIVSLALSGLIPLIDTVGLAATYTVTAIVSWFGFGLIWLMIRYGDKLRAYVDIGFSTVRDN